MRAVCASPTAALARYRLSFKDVGELRPHFPDTPRASGRTRTARGTCRSIYQLLDNDRTVRVTAIGHRSIAYRIDPR